VKKWFKLNSSNAATFFNLSAAGGLPRQSRGCDLAVGRSGVQFTRGNQRRGGRAAAAISFRARRRNAVTVNAPPSLFGFKVSNGQFQFQVSGPTNFTYTVQASSNLVTWTNLLVTNPPVLPFVWQDSTTNLPRRFCRAIAAP
jgi:hypothetical protein